MMLLDKIIVENINKFLKNNLVELNQKRQTKPNKEQMLVDLFNYLSQEPTDDIYDGGNKGKSYINTHYKAYNYFEPKEIVHNVWAIHYTNLEGYEGIKLRGFRIGTPNFDELAYSANYYDYDTKRKYGWNFALPIDNEYLGEDLGYGDCGFIIKTDGVKAYHKGDKDDEIIFKGCHVKKKIPFIYDNDYDCYILSDNYDFNINNLPKGAYYNEEIELVVFDNISDLINFVIK